MRALSVTITSPMPGAVLAPTFELCGTFEARFELDKITDRNSLLEYSPTIQVTVTKGSSTYGPFPASICHDETGWRATATGIPIDTGYTVTAQISDGVDQASHSIETVDVVEEPQIVVRIVCCPKHGEELSEDTHVVLFKPGDVGKQVDLDGKFKPANATEMFGMPYSIRVRTVTTTLPGGGKHRHVIYSHGSPTGIGKFGEPLDKENKKWKLKKIEVDFQQCVMVFLKRNTQIIAKNASALF